VIRVDRRQPVSLGIERPLRFQHAAAQPRAIALDLKDPAAVETVLELVEQADALLEGFRPGVAERLGLGPDGLPARNPRLAYGRLTGWGQHGPLARRRGHDINYLALTGILERHRPRRPAAHDAAELRRRLCRRLALHGGRAAGGDPRGARLRRGQVVDAAIVDGAAHLATTFFGMVAGGIWRAGAAPTSSDGGSHFYDCYECADGRWIAVGPIEEKFFRSCCERLGIDPESLGPQCRASTGKPPGRLAAQIRPHRDEWARAADAPMLRLAVLSSTRPRHPHLQARGTSSRSTASCRPRRRRVLAHRAADPTPRGRSPKTRPGLVGLFAADKIALRLRAA
jgi:crotonobetainyl-CoA:carnitine CoA-transferase CaiB-like acyl-CoA transferase